MAETWRSDEERQLRCYVRNFMLTFVAFWATLLGVGCAVIYGLEYIEVREAVGGITGLAVALAVAHQMSRRFPV